MHSAEVGDDGNPVDSNSFYAKFIDQLRADWEVIDEGPMSDLLGIDCERGADGSILLHQGAYVRKLLSQGLRPMVQSISGVRYLTPLIFLGS